MKNLLDRLSDKILSIEIPSTDEEWANFPRTWKGKLILFIVQCGLAVLTVLIVVKVFL